MTPLELSNRQEQGGQVPGQQGHSDPFRAAVVSLLREAKYFLGLYLLLLLPPITLTLLAPSSGAILIGLRVLERLLELAVLFLVARRLISVWSTQGPGTQSAVRSPSEVATLTVFFGVGLISWFTLLCPTGIIPFEILFTAASPGGLGPALFMALPAGFVWYLHFFWGFSLLLPGMGLTERITLAREIVARDPWSPVKVVLGPSALQFLPTLLALTPYPDGRSVEWSLVADLFSGLQWLLCAVLMSTYAASLLTTDERTRAGLADPAELKDADSLQHTIAAEGHWWLRLFTRFLRPKPACQLIGVCLLLWAANMGRLSTLAPSPSLRIQSALQEAPNSIRVTLEAQDDSHHFRGFRPLQFRIVTGSDGQPWSQFPESAQLNGAPGDVRVFFPPHSGTVRIDLTFRDHRPLNPSSEGAQSTTDAPAEKYSLWYGGHNVGELQLTTSTVSPLEPPAPGP